jgi:hypothetical protein
VNLFVIGVDHRDQLVQPEVPDPQDQLERLALLEVEELVSPVLLDLPVQLELPEAMELLDYWVVLDRQEVREVQAALVR